MNCIRCNAPLDSNARFCRNCGLPVAASQPQEAIRLPQPPQPADEAVRSPYPSPQTQTQPWSPPSRPQQTPFSPQPQVPQTPYIPLPSQPTTPAPQYSQANTPQRAQEPSPPNYYQHYPAGTGAKMPPAVVTAPRRHRGGCILGCLGTIIVLLLILGLAWVFAIRPFIHDTAITQMDHAMSTAVNEIPPQISQAPPGPVTVQETVLNNLLVLNIAPSDPVQDTNMQIMPSGVSLTFKLYGQPCTITGIPQAQSGKLVATNVTDSGIISLFLSPSDITALLNKHLADAQTRINHTVQQVQLGDHEMILTLG